MTECINQRKKRLDYEGPLEGTWDESETRKRFTPPIYDDRANKKWDQKSFMGIF